MLIDMISFTTICLIYLWFYYQHCMNEKYIGRELKIEKTEEDLKEVITIGYIVSIFMIFNIWKNREEISMKVDTYYLLFFSILFKGHYLCAKYGISENILFVDFNDYDWKF